MDMIRVLGAAEGAEEVVSYTSRLERARGLQVLLFEEDSAALDQSSDAMDVVCQ